MISFKDYCKRVDEAVQLDESASRFIQKVNQAANAAASGKHKNAQMHLDNARSFMLGVKSTDMEKIKDAHETYKNLRKKYSGSGGNFTPSHNQVGNAKVSESEELEEGSIANIEQKLKDHAQRKIDHEAKYGQMNGADLHSHEVTRTRLLQQKKKLQSAKMRSESEEQDDHVTQPLAEAIKGWKHAHTDIMKSRAAASASAKPIQLRRLTAKGTESSMVSSEQSAFNSHEDAQAHVDNMHKMNPGKKFSYNKYENGKHVGVVTKS